MKIFFVDPQSYLNLAVYDKSLLANVCKIYEVTFLCSTQYDGGEISGVNVRPVFSYNKKKGIRKILSYIFSLLKIAKYTVAERPDIVHIQWLKIESVDYWIYRTIKAVIKSKIVFTAHNILPHNTGNAYLRIYKKFYHLVDAIIVHDENSKNELSTKLEINENKISVIRHGILNYKVNEEQIEAEIKDLQQRYHLNDSKLLLSVVGFQNKYKGTDVLLKAWTKSVETNNNNDYCLLIAGRCRELDFLNDISQCKNIYVEDEFISTERLIAILKLTDALLLPYKRISQSGVLLTAIEYGTPFLVTNVGGLSEPLAYGDVGWMIPECEEELLVDFLNNILPDHSAIKAKRSNSNGWDKVRAAYSWDAIGNKTSELYESLV